MGPNELFGVVYTRALAAGAVDPAACTVAAMPACLIEAARRGWELSALLTDYIDTQVALAVDRATAAAALPVVIAPPTTLAVAGMVTLMDWRDLSGYGSLLFSLVNLGTLPVDLYVETSQNGAAPDRVGKVGDSDNPITVQPGFSGSLEVGAEQLRRFFRMKANASAPTQVQWEVLGTARG